MKSVGMRRGDVRYSEMRTHPKNDGRARGAGYEKTPEGLEQGPRDRLEANGGAIYMFSTKPTRILPKVEIQPLVFTKVGCTMRESGDHRSATRTGTVSVRVLIGARR
jgi:hypothetical protein